MPLAPHEYLTLADENSWINEFADNWILDQDTGGGDFNILNMEFSFGRDAGAADGWLAAIITIAHRTMDGRHDSVLAAGMLEDFLGKHGEVYIDIVAILAKESPRFRNLLGGVWRGSMTKNVWHKIEVIRDKAW
jgi:hypothetical protein